MANSHVSNINFNSKGDGTKWVSVSQIDSTGALAIIAAGTNIYVEEVYCSITFAAITNVFAVVHVRVSDAAGNIIWGGGTNSGGHVGVPANGLSINWISEIGTNPVAEVTVIYRYISGTAPTAV